MILPQALIDLLLALGGFIGLVTKVYALIDEKTVWSRKSSGFNVASYPLTALLPFYALGLPFTFLASFLNFCVWIGIFIFRAPETEDWLGRKKL
jgi:hypothetical protein